MEREKAMALANKLFLVCGMHWRQYMICGSARRGKAEVGDIDFVIIGDPEMTKLKAVEAGWKIISGPKGKKRISLLKDDLQVDLLFTEPECFGAACMHFTGPMALNVVQRGQAISMGLKLNEYGLWNGPQRVAGAYEKEVYEKLGLPFLTPEEREKYG